MESHIQALRGAFPTAKLECSADKRGILTLSGECESWEQLVAAGHMAAKLPGVRNVVSEMTVAGVDIPRKDYSAALRAGEEIGDIAEADVLIIGAGVSGCGIARELAKYDLDIIVVDKAEDVATGATRANNGNIHPGHSVEPGTLKARLNVRGNAMYGKWAEELGFELRRCGAMGAATDERLTPYLEAAHKIGVVNGVEGIEMVSAERAYELEPGLKRAGYDDIVSALWIPSMGLVEPYKVVVALAENAAENGVRFMLKCEVAGILRGGGKAVGAVTGRGIIRAKYIVNCAGSYADDISAMAGDKCFTIHPRKGTIAILDKNREPLYESLAEVFTMESFMAAKKNANSKGGGMCYTPERNILMGPSATEVPDKEDLSTTPGDLAYAMGRGELSGIRYGDIIRFFAGSRPADFTEDFVIGMSDITDGFVNVGGIQSPGLAAAPAVAETVVGILAESAEKRGEPFAPRKGYNPIRKRETEFRHLSREAQDELIRKDPRYGRVVCRCESITEGEILDALKSPVKPMSIDAVKRRTRAGMGRCQGGFCQPRVLEILARELGLGWTDICLSGEGSNVLTKDSRGGADIGKRVTDE